MVPHQWLIGGVALIIGSLALGGAVANSDGLFQLAKMRLLQDLLGRSGARWACGALGCGLIVLGGLIVAGVLPRKTSRNDGRQPLHVPLKDQLAFAG
jgi:hypothetical protein